MAIPSVVNGFIHVEDGSLVDPNTSTGLVYLNNPEGFKWLESVDSFRFVPNGEGLKPYTVRRESGYWYGYRKMAGRLHKKYIGKTSEPLWTGVLETIAEALNVPPEPRLPKVTQRVTEDIAQLVTDSATTDRLTALELQVQALQESLEALRGELLGKSEGLDDSLESFKPEVVDCELQTKLCNLESENEELRRQLENSDRLVKHKNQEISELNSRLAAANQKISDRDEEIENLESKIQNLESELAERLVENSAPARDLVEKAPKILSFFKPWLSPKTPKNVLSKLEEFLEDD